MNTKCEKQGTAVDSSLLFRRDRFGDQQNDDPAGIKAAVVSTTTTVIVSTTASTA